MLAKENGIKALTVETLSCSVEPPSFPDEILSLMQTFEEYHASIHPQLCRSIFAATSRMAWRIRTRRAAQ
jgi:hypothetical protein